MHPSALPYLNPLFLCIIFLPARSKCYKESNIDFCCSQNRALFCVLNDAPLW